MLHLPHLAHVLHPYGTLGLPLQFCAPLVFLLSLLMTCGVWQPQDKASRGCILDHFRRIFYADTSKINDVIFALGSSHDTSTHRAFYLIALIIVFNFRPKPPITPKSLLPSSTIHNPHPLAAINHVRYARQRGSCSASSSICNFEERLC